MPCTVLIVAPTGSKGPFVAHTLDTGGGVDFRLVRVPACSSPVTPRPVFSWDENRIPRYRGESRGDISEYKALPGELDSPGPLATIPQVQSTFAYWEAHQGIMNEKGLMLAETTCGSIFISRGPPEGKALLSYEEITRIALERTSSARDAIDLMGALVVEHGFKGGGTSLGASGETLGVADSKEAWVFHVMPDNTGTSGIWAAQRVPDGEATAVCNMFIIRNMELDDPDNFRYSQSALKVAEELGLWKPGTPFDFTSIYSSGETHNKYYSGRRMWRALSLLAPSQKLSPYYEDLVKAPAHPFSVRLEASMDRHQLFRILRDTYDGTEFDLSKQLVSGPYGIVDRFDRHRESDDLFERPIGSARMKYSFVCESASDPIVWFGAHASVSSVYLPVLQSMTNCPDPLRLGFMKAVDRRSAYWAFRSVKHLALMRWDCCIAMIRERQSKWEKIAADLVDAEMPIVEKEPKLHALAAEVLADWWTLYDELLVRFGDGWEYDFKEKHANTPANTDDECRPLAYPEDWMKKFDVRSFAPPPRVEWTLEKKQEEFALGKKRSIDDVDHANVPAKRSQ